VTIQALGLALGRPLPAAAGRHQLGRFWYQTEPHAPFPKLPTKDALEVQ
jgi:hypothetical protein